MPNNENQMEGQRAASSFIDEITQMETPGLEQRVIDEEQRALDEEQALSVAAEVERANRWQELPSAAQEGCRCTHCRQSRVDAGFAPFEGCSDDSDDSDDSDNSVRAENHPELSSYDSTPDLTFCSYRNDWDADSSPYLGFELEIELGEDTNIDKAIDLANKIPFVTLMQDGSLDNGFEIVSNPGTHKYFKSINNLRNIMDELSGIGCTSHDTKTCGLHIHVDKKYLNADQQDALVYFINKHKSIIEKISRRKQNQYCEYHAHICSSKKDARFRAMNEGKYAAVNTNKTDTIEIRTFRGTLNYDTLMATLLFVKKLYAYIKLDTSVSKLSDWNLFMGFIYGEYSLTRYFDKRDVKRVEATELTEEINTRIEGITNTVSQRDFEMLISQQMEPGVTPTVLDFNGNRYTFETDTDIPYELRSIEMNGKVMPYDERVQESSFSAQELRNLRQAFIRVYNSVTSRVVPRANSGRTTLYDRPYFEGYIARQVEAGESEPAIVDQSGNIFSLEVNPHTTHNRRSGLLMNGEMLNFENMESLSDFSRRELRILRDVLRDHAARVRRSEDTG